MSITIRDFYPLNKLLAHYGLEHSGLAPVLKLVLLPVNYFMEFGIFAVCGFFYWKTRLTKKAKMSSDEMLDIVIFITSLGMCTFLKSVLLGNDLGWRGMLFAQFILLLWSANYLSRRLTRASAFLIILLSIGLLTTTHDLISTRFITMIGNRVHVLETGKRNYALRETYEWINHHVSLNDTVQHKPEAYSFAHEFWGTHQAIASDLVLGTIFGIPGSWYNRVKSDLDPIFTRNDETYASTICQKYQIDFLVFESGNPNWNNRASWIWKKTPAFTNAYTRVLKCPKAVP